MELWVFALVVMFDIITLFEFVKKNTFFVFVVFLSFVLY